MITVVSRQTRLARLQVQEVMGLLPHVRYTHRTLATWGDEHQGISLLEPHREDIFTDTLDEAVLSGNADAAIHSAKDLPWPLHHDLRVVALTQALDNADCLVSRGNVPLARLPAGGRVGVSSPRRKEHVLAVRPDVVPVSIRGSIEQRLAYIDRGEVDAIVVAACALKRLGIAHCIAETLPFAAHPLQGRCAVAAHRKRRDIALLFRSIDMRRTFGTVYLVGAGPGDPGLITLKAMDILRRADEVYYDDLCAPEIIETARGARIYVGKRGGRGSIPQDTINERLYRAALAGKRVVRLKGGDPLIFGRGGEEIEFLQRRLIDVEVIPGIPAAQACAARYCIPLTRREVSPSLTIASARYADVHRQPPPADGTAAYYMAAGRLRELSETLIRQGRPPDTPAALVRNVGRVDERIVVTTVGDMAGVTLSSPVTVIVGDTVKAARIGRNILYTGIDPAAYRGDGHVVHYPLVETRPLPFTHMDADVYDAMVFTSPRAVDYFFAHTTEFPRVPAYAIGPATAQKIRTYRLNVAGIAAYPDSTHLAEMLRRRPHTAILYPCSGLAENALHRLPNIRPLVVYTTFPRRQPPVALDEFSAIVFTSPSTVDAFAALYTRFPSPMEYIVFGICTKQRLLHFGVSETFITIEATSKVRSPLSEKEVIE